MSRSSRSSAVALQTIADIGSKTALADRRESHQIRDSRGERRVHTVAILGTRYADFARGGGGARHRSVSAFVSGREPRRTSVAEVAGDADVILAGSGPRFDAATIATASLPWASSAAAWASRRRPRCGARGGHVGRPRRRLRHRGSGAAHADARPRRRARLARGRPPHASGRLGLRVATPAPPPVCARRRSGRASGGIGRRAAELLAGARLRRSSRTIPLPRSTPRPCGTSRSTSCSPAPTSSRCTRPRRPTAGS